MTIYLVTPEVFSLPQGSREPKATSVGDEGIPKTGTGLSA